MIVNCPNWNDAWTVERRRFGCNEACRDFAGKRYDELEGRGRWVVVDQASSRPPTFPRIHVDVRGSTRNVRERGTAPFTLICPMMRPCLLRTSRWRGDGLVEQGWWQRSQPVLDALPKRA